MSRPTAAAAALQHCSQFTVRRVGIEKRRRVNPRPTPELRN